MSERNWARDGRDWPNRDSSRFVRAAGLQWHVQVMGAGPVLLLLHGTGAATHSWRAMAPLLARHFTVVAPDMPGHGFTESPSKPRLSLPGMAKSLHGLLQILNLSPVLAAGHSAGAAIALRMALDGMPVRGLVGLNGAFLPMEGIPGQIFSPMAKLLAGLPGLAELFAWRAKDDTVTRLLEGTGSRIDAQGAMLYGRMIRNPAHAAAALGMMSQWDLRPLLQDLHRLTAPLLLIVGANDRSVPPAQSGRVAGLVPGAQLLTMPGLGHLAHEEKPNETAEAIVAFARTVGVIPA
ncbi:MAG: alpha/beta fold hydrolase [Gemmatimonadaceae bacterium]|nr:alpha/beta fold hydrolase [Acetobacteraceae bacterium]